MIIEDLPQDIPGIPGITYIPPPEPETSVHLTDFEPDDDSATDDGDPRDRVELDMPDDLDIPYLPDFEDAEEEMDAERRPR